MIIKSRFRIIDIRFTRQQIGLNVRMPNNLDEEVETGTKSFERGLCIFKN